MRNRVNFIWHSCKLALYLTIQIETQASHYTQLQRFWKF